MYAVKRGDHNWGTRILQRLLGISADAIFGGQTEKAVTNWRKAHKLPAATICDAVMWAALAAVQLRLKTGSSGNPVKAVQDALNIEVDGRYGPITQAAIDALRKLAGLPVGVMDAAAWRYLLTQFKLGSLPTTVPIRPVDYKQYDSRWGAKMYSNHGDSRQTIRNSGCGPTAMADIIATWWDPKITPVQATALAVSGGFCTYSDGTARAYFGEMAKRYGASRFQRTTDTSIVKAALQNGALVIALMGKGYWTGGGHYICCYRYDKATDLIYANDPASSVRKYASAATFARERKEYFIFYK